MKETNGWKNYADDGAPPSIAYFFYKASDELVNATADELTQYGWDELEVVEKDGLYSTAIGVFDFNPGRVFRNETLQYVAITDYEIGTLIADCATGIISNTANEDIDGALPEPTAV